MQPIDCDYMKSTSMPTLMDGFNSHWGDMVDKQLAISYGSVSLFSAVLHNVFLLYHVEMFVSVYKIDKFSFWICEAIFLLWNSCNDPIFGWLSDRSYLVKNVGRISVVLKRLQALRWSGPLFAVSFLAFWVSWTYPPGTDFYIISCWFIHHINVNFLYIISV